MDDEVRWLREADVDAHTHEVSNDDVIAASPTQKLRQAGGSLWSTTAAARLAEEIDSRRPHIVHIHNLFPLLSASVPWNALRRGTPVVWTVHNHRVTCVSGNNYRDGQPCHLCRRGWRVPGIRYGCYAESHGASALVTAASSIFSSLARRRIAAIAISNAIRSWVVQTAGFPAERVHVKHNGVAPPPEQQPLPSAASSRMFLFAGHLTDHKGVSLLLDAWRRADLPDNTELRILGEGPLDDMVRSSAERDDRISWLGHRPHAEMAQHFAEARAVVMPSTWDEPFGRSAAEALSYGRPVVTTGTGGLSEVVNDECGWITGTAPDALADALAAASKDDAELARRSRRATERYNDLFTPEATTERLIQIYRHEIDRANRSTSAQADSRKRGPWT